MVVDLIHKAFREGMMVEEATWQAVVLISKGERGLPFNWPHGGDVEGSGSDFKLLDHSLHHLP